MVADASGNRLPVPDLDVNFRAPAEIYMTFGGEHEAEANEGTGVQDGMEEIFPANFT